MPQDGKIFERFGRGSIDNGRTERAHYELQEKAVSGCAIRTGCRRRVKRETDTQGRASGTRALGRSAAQRGPRRPRSADGETYVGGRRVTSPMRRRAYRADGSAGSRRPSLHCAGGRRCARVDEREQH